MKKQYQLVIGILVTGVFFCTNQDDNLKACGTNTTACATIQKKDVPKKKIESKDIPTEYGEDTDTGIYMFMNPFIQ
ncbi:MAG: hypothetical protein ABIO79_12895 [Ferruginibacter sp.]